MPKPGNKTPCTKRSDHYNHRQSLGQDRIRPFRLFCDDLESIPFEAPVEKPKKSRRKKLIIWLCIDLVAAAGLLVLLLYKPARYHPVMAPVEADPNGRRVHPYFSHDLMPTLYNGAQDRHPFKMEVVEKSLNEAIGQTGWLEASDGIQLSAPAVAFVPGRVVLMATADIQGADFVITVEISPQILEDGRLNLVVEKVKIGVMNVTWPAKKLGRKMYLERVEAGDVDTDDWRTKIAASLLNDEPFEPVFPVDDKWVRLKSLDIVQGKLTTGFVPAK